MSKAFDTVNIHKLIQKIHNTNISNTIIKCISNYTKGRKSIHNISQQNLQTIPKSKQVYSQGGVLSPTLFNIYMSDIPTLPDNIKLFTYAADINSLSTHPNINAAQDNIQPYLQQIHDWTTQNDLQLNPDKSTSTLFTLDSSEYNT